MTHNEHEEQIQKIQAETEDIRRQMMQFEFQHKKDIADFERRSEQWHNHTREKIDHLIKLVGLTYDELDEIDATLTETGVILTRPRKRARIK
jgi:hypothetical protein